MYFVKKNALWNENEKSESQIQMLGAPLWKPLQFPQGPKFIEGTVACAWNIEGRRPYNGGCHQVLQSKHVKQPEKFKHPFWQRNEKKRENELFYLIWGPFEDSTCRKDKAKCVQSEKTRTIRRKKTKLPSSPEVPQTHRTIFLTRRTVKSFCLDLFLTTWTQ